MKTVEDYKQRGIDHARNGCEKAPYLRASTSWQAKAYWEARDAESERLTAYECAALEDDRVEEQTQTNNGIKPEHMAANTKGWPSGAAEHARLLAKMSNEEKSPGRRRRLVAALQRLQIRYIKP